MNVLFNLNANSTSIKSFPSNHYEFIICCALNYKNTTFIGNLLSASQFRNNYEFTMELLWNRYEISWNSLFCFAIFLRIHYLLWILFIFREFTLNSLSYSRNHYENTIFFAISLRIRCLFRDFTMDSLSFSRNHCEFTFFFENLF